MCAIHSFNSKWGILVQKVLSSVERQSISVYVFVLHMCLTSSVFSVYFHLNSLLPVLSGYWVAVCIILSMNCRYTNFLWCWCMDVLSKAHFSSLMPFWCYVHTLLLYLWLFIVHFDVFTRSSENYCIGVLCLFEFIINVYDELKLSFKLLLVFVVHFQQCLFSLSRPLYWKCNLLFLDYCLHQKNSLFSETEICGVSIKINL